MSFLSLMASLGLNASGFETGLKKAESQAHHFGKEISGEIKGKLAAAFGGAAIEEAFRRTMEYAHKLKDLNLRTGLSTDELQTWDFAAMKANSTIEEMVGAMEKLGIAQAKALGPEGAETFQALTRLGLSADDIRNLEDLRGNMVKIFDTIRENGTNGQVLKDFREAFGRGAMPLIAVAKEGLDEAKQRLDEIHGRLNPEQIDRMAESTARWKEIWFQFRPVIASINLGFADFFHASIEGQKALYTGISETGKKLLELKDLSYSGLASAIMSGKAAAQEYLAEQRLEEIRRDAARFGFHVPKEGEEPNPFAGLNKPPVALDAQEQKKADEVHKQFLEEQLKLELEQASAVEKRFILQRRISDFEEQASHLRNKMKFAVDVDPRDQVKLEEILLNKMKAQGELAGLKHTAARGHFDSLARIGGFGQTADMGLGAVKTHLQQIVKHTAATAHNTSHLHGE